MAHEEHTEMKAMLSGLPLNAYLSEAHGGGWQIQTCKNEKMEEAINSVDLDIEEVSICGLCQMTKNNYSSNSNNNNKRQYVFSSRANSPWIGGGLIMSHKQWSNVPEGFGATVSFIYRVSEAAAWKQGMACPARRSGISPKAGRSCFLG